VIKENSRLNVKLLQRHLQKKETFFEYTGKSRKSPGHALIPGDILLGVDPHYRLKEHTILFNIF
jgi:hypothetical protein